MLLIGTEPGGKTIRIRLRTIGITKPITLGRGREASITLDDPKTSRVHSAIRYWDDIFIVRDCHSRNGTYVNGNKVSVARLNPGDTLTIGNTNLLAQSEPKDSDVTVPFDIGDIDDIGD